MLGRAVFALVENIRCAGPPTSITADMTQTDTSIQPAEGDGGTRQREDRPLTTAAPCRVGRIREWTRDSPQVRVHRELQATWSAFPLPLNKMGN